MSGLDVSRHLLPWASCKDPETASLVRTTCFRKADSLPFNAEPYARELLNECVPLRSVLRHSHEPWCLLKCHNAAACFLRSGCNLGGRLVRFSIVRGFHCERVHLPTMNVAASFASSSLPATV